MNSSADDTDATTAHAMNEAKCRAFRFAVSAIDPHASFPGQVFQGRWAKFLFFESDRMFAPEFAAIASELLRAEPANLLCLLNLTQAQSTDLSDPDEHDWKGSSALLFVDPTTEPAAYAARLRQGGPAEAWLYDMDRFACASDGGAWAMYCEKQNDVAVIALRTQSDTGRFDGCLKRFCAEPIATLLNDGLAAPFPFSHLIEPWQRSLEQHYSESAWTPAAS